MNPAIQALENPNVKTKGFDNNNAREIPIQIGQLKSLISHHGHLIDVIHERIECLLTPSAPVSIGTTSDSKFGGSVNTPIGQDIANMSAHISIYTAQLEDLINRLEV